MSGITCPVSHFRCHLSGVTCQVSHATGNSQTIRYRELKFWEKIPRVSHTKCYKFLCFVIFPFLFPFFDLPRLVLLYSKKNVLQDEEPLILDDHTVFLLLVCTLCLLVLLLVLVGLPVLVLVGLPVLVCRTVKLLRPASAKRDCPCKHCQHSEKNESELEGKHDQIMAV